MVRIKEFLARWDVEGLNELLNCIRCSSDNTVRIEVKAKPLSIVFLSQPYPDNPVSLDIFVDVYLVTCTLTIVLLRGVVVPESRYFVHSSAQLQHVHHISLGSASLVGYRVHLLSIGLSRFKSLIQGNTVSWLCHHSITEISFSSD
jgi:hypothetical protein